MIYIIDIICQYCDTPLVEWSKIPHYGSITLCNSKDNNISYIIMDMNNLTKDEINKKTWRDAVIILKSNIYPDDGNIFRYVFKFVESKQIERQDRSIFIFLTNQNTNNYLKSWQHSTHYKTCKFFKHTIDNSASGGSYARIDRFNLYKTMYLTDKSDEKDYYFMIEFNFKLNKIIFVGTALKSFSHSHNNKYYECDISETLINQ